MSVAVTTSCRRRASHELSEGGASGGAARVAAAGVAAAGGTSGCDSCVHETPCPPVQPDFLRARPCYRRMGEDVDLEPSDPDPVADDMGPGATDVSWRWRCSALPTD